MLFPEAAQELGASRQSDRECIHLSSPYSFQFPVRFIRTLSFLDVPISSPPLRWLEMEPHHIPSSVGAAGLFIQQLASSQSEMLSEEADGIAMGGGLSHCSTKCLNRLIPGRDPCLLYDGDEKTSPVPCIPLDSSRLMVNKYLCSRVNALRLRVHKVSRLSSAVLKQPEFGAVRAFNHSKDHTAGLSVTQRDRGAISWQKENRNCILHNAYCSGQRAEVLQIQGSPHFTNLCGCCNPCT